MPMRPYFCLFPPGASVETRTLIARGAKGLPDGKYRFIEFYCDEPGCDCRRATIQVWDEDDNPVATISYGWETPEYYAQWSREKDPRIIKEMASATLEFLAPQSRYANAFLAQFRKAVREPAYLEKIRQHHAEFRAAVDEMTAPPKKPRVAAKPKPRPKLQPKPKGAVPAGAEIYQLEIVLRGSSPPIWRRVQVPGSVTLADLHDVIQLAMGWEGAHLSRFQIGDQSFSIPMPGADFEQRDDEDAFEVFLDEVCPRPRMKLLYEYDFGDGWEHDIRVEKIMAPEAGVRYPLCVAGERACPPEDCGGIPGYYNLLDALADPEHESHEESKEWFADDWDAEAFDLAAANKLLRRLPI